MAPADGPAGDPPPDDGPVDPPEPGDGIGPTEPVDPGEGGGLEEDAGDPLAVPAPGAAPHAAVPIHHEELRRRAVSGSMWTAIHSVTALPINFVSHLVVARELGPAGYGTVAVYSLILVLVTKISEAGINGATAMWGTAEDASGHPEVADRLLRQDTGWQLLVEVPLLGVLMLVIGWRAGPAILIPLLISVLLGALLAGPSLAVAVENRTAAAARLTGGANTLMQVAIMVVAVRTHSPIAVWTTRVLATSLTGAIYLIPIDRRRRWLVLKPLFPRGMPVGFWSFAGFATATALVGELASSRTEVFFLALYGLRADIGYFALAFGLATQLTAPVDAVITPLGSGIIGLVATRPQRASAVLLRSTRYVAAASGVLTAVALPAITMLIPMLYGHAYRSAAPLLIPLGIASCLNSLCNPLTSFVSARRRADVVLRAGLIALGADAAAALALIPIIGVWGAVVANIIGGIGHLPSLIAFELKNQGGRLIDLVASAKAWLVSIAACIPAVAAGLVVNQLWGRPVVDAVAAGVVGGAVFVLAVRLLHAGFDREDRESFTSSGPALLRLPLRLGLSMLGTP